MMLLACQLIIGERFGDLVAETIHSPRLRKNRVISVLNCPNPEEQVFCDFVGDRTATFYLNTAEVA